MADPAEIRRDVLNLLESSSGKPASRIRGKDRLKIELRLDHAAHVFLAMRLRGYVKRRAPGKSLSVFEIEKDGLTAERLIEIVLEKVGS